MNVMTTQPHADARGTRKLPWDWYPGTIPENVAIDETAYVETSFSFHAYRSRAAVGVEIGPGASTDLGTMFDVGPRGSVSLGRCALVHGARIICDERVEIGDYALISWNVVIMDTYRVPTDPVLRRRHLQQAALAEPRCLAAGERDGVAERDGAGGGDVIVRPVRVGPNVWIGFDACVLPGVSIGEGSIVGAKSVVVADVEPYTVVGGNPAKVLRRLDAPDRERQS
jgi:acetyltransferase-like isoleucine patch superfamily enzyme